MNTVESNHMMLDLEAEITKTTELIQKLTEAEESIRQRLNIITEKCNAMQQEISNNKHRILKDRMDELMDEILWLEKFPRVNYHVPSFHTITQISTPKEPAESVQRLKIKFHHSNKSLAAERKMAKELQLREREEEQQSEVQVEEQNLNLKSFRRRTCSGWRPLGNITNIRSMISIWARKVEFISTLVLRDSKNMTPKWQTRANLNDLRATSYQMYWEPQIAKAEFMKHWDSMKHTRKSFELDLKKAGRRHQESYAESERLREKRLEILNPYSELRNESNKLLQEQSIARKYLRKLQKQQNEITT